MLVKVDTVIFTTNIYNYSLVAIFEEDKEYRVTGHTLTNIIIKDFKGGRHSFENPYMDSTGNSQLKLSKVEITNFEEGVKLSEEGIKNFTAWISQRNSDIKEEALKYQKEGGLFKVIKIKSNGLIMIDFERQQWWVDFDDIDKESIQFQMFNN